MTKIKMILLGLGALAIVTTIGFGYMHYQGIVNENKVLIANNEKLELSVQTQSDTIDAAEQTIRDWEEALRRVEERNRQLEGIANDARIEQQRIQRMFDELDIAGSAVDDPVGLADDLNRRFDYLNCMFEANTGTGNQDCTSRLDPGPDIAPIP